MGVVSPADFESLLSELNREEFIAFVTDLWTAREMETAVSGDVIIASRGHESVRIRAWYRPTAPWDPLLNVGPKSDSSERLDDIDVLATNTDSERLRTVSETENVEYVGPVRLRRLCLYAIERDRAEELFQRYFDRPVEDESETRAATGWDRIPSMNGDGTGWFGGRFAQEAGTVVEALVLTAVVAALFLAMLSAANAPGGVLFHGRSPDDPGGGGLDIRRILVSAGSPPGIGRRTLDDATALVSAHERALDDRTYRLTIHHNGTRGHLVTTDRWRHTRQRIRKQSRNRYRVTVDGELSPSTFGGDPYTVRFDLELRGQNCTGRSLEDERGSSVDPCEVVRSDEISSLDHVTPAYLGTYLDGETSTVRVRRQSGRVRYRVVVRGSPENLSVPAENYTAVALVDERGLVRAFNVTYETPLVDRTGQVRLSFRFEDVKPAP